MGALSARDRGEVARVFGTLYSADLVQRAPFHLTSRDAQLLRFYADGATDAEIATALGLNVKSVGTLGTRLRRRMQAASRSHAVAIALRSGIMP